jgi:hypothetical protein
MMPLYAGAALVLLVMVVAPVWFMMSNRNSPNLTTTSANANKPNVASQANANSTNAGQGPLTTPTVSSPVPVVPKLVSAPADFMRFLRLQPEFEEPVKVAEVDLNGDGIPELLAQYERCGSGGCTIHLFRQTSGGFKDIGGAVSENMFAGLGDDAHGSFLAGPNSTRGYLDLKYVFKQGRRSETFKFDGQQYRTGR